MWLIFDMLIENRLIWIWVPSPQSIKKNRSCTEST
jgi:hypothetical protein